MLKKASILFLAWFMSCSSPYSPTHNEKAELELIDPHYVMFQRCAMPENKVTGEIEISGEVSNPGDHTANNVRVCVDLYDDKECCVLLDSGTCVVCNQLCGHTTIEFEVKYKFVIYEWADDPPIEGVKLSLKWE